MAEGYAILTEDGIEVMTVSARETAAMVSYLFLKGYAVSQGTPDEYVKELFDHLSEPADMVVPVVVSRKHLN